LVGIETLKFAPIVRNKEVGTEIVTMFEQMTLVPTLFFVDPWGYKGLSLRLINSVLKDWGCDCIFFFNYNRISMGLGNDFVKEHMDVLFGEERANQLRHQLQDTSSSHERELTIVEALAQALKEMGGRFVLPFRFRNEKGNRTSHHLIFVSKHFRGYEIMKDIMATESSSLEEGVPSLEYNVATARQPLLFQLSRPLGDLKESLLTEFSGQSKSMQEIYEMHSVDRPFLKKNYKAALKELEAEGRISTKPNASVRRKDTFADTVQVIFPVVK
jgi:hypothetical protein